MDKKRILIVDDEDKFGRMVKMVLDAAGEYEVKVEPRGKQALATSHAFKPDLIFLDIAMPDMDGTEVASQMREDAVLKDIPIVFLTGMILKKETKPDSKIGKYPIIAKPISADEIVEAIRKNLR